MFLEYLHGLNLTNVLRTRHCSLADINKYKFACRASIPRLIDIHWQPLYNICNIHQEQPVLKELAEKDGRRLKAAAESQNRSRLDSMPKKSKRE